MPTYLEDLEDDVWEDDEDGYTYIDPEFDDKPPEVDEDGDLIYYGDVPSSKALGSMAFTKEVFEGEGGYEQDDFRRSG